MSIYMCWLNVCYEIDKTKWEDYEIINFIVPHSKKYWLLVSLNCDDNYIIKWFNKLFDIDNFFKFLKCFIGYGAVPQVIAVVICRMPFGDLDSTIFAPFYGIINNILTITLKTLIMKYGICIPFSVPSLINLCCCIVFQVYVLTWIWLKNIELFIHLNFCNIDINSRSSILYMSE